LSQSGVFDAFFEALAAMSPTAHLVQMFDSTIVRAHVSAAGAKGGQENQALGRSRGVGRSRKPMARSRRLNSRAVLSFGSSDDASPARSEGDAPNPFFVTAKDRDYHTRCGRPHSRDLITGGGDDTFTARNAALFGIKCRDST
jgi:hypothetical protein